MRATANNANNIFLESAKYAGAGFAIATLVSGVMIGLLSPKERAANRWGVSAALLGLVGGGAVGLIQKRQSQSGLDNEQIKIDPQPTGKEHWKGWRNFIVAHKVKESEEIISFYLEPQDRGELSQFEPGQFLTLKLNIPGQEKPVIRTYSLSDYPIPVAYYRLSIKREPAPSGLNVMAGIVSNYLHDHIGEGSVIAVRPPSGNFVIDVHKSLPAVLISNGVGITPMISMAIACCYLNPNRPIWFVHGTRNGLSHAFRDDILALAQKHPNMHVHFAYSRPRPEDNGFYHSEGYIDSQKIKQLVAKEAEFFLCGSPSFMESLRSGLKMWGVPDNQVFYESFERVVSNSIEQPQIAATDKGIALSQIVFAESSRELTWTIDDGTLLEFAEANNIYPPFSCRSGICGTCMCKILEGEVAYQQAPTAAIEPGSALICISKPRTSKVILAL
ncbi:oxidoreductase FAD/NAD(P)-binding subunit [Calothrix sp. NIES-4071]|nr:oxidoreductase FAD/NAD(P)-binding subunit [Calothrix sp. NIES-4071]BAZ55286.1 oxidoreductase FAD/NAD(P)-binding subunit [Calothrix sp. NIES-4105]